jgi:hypothetical protein
MDRQLLTVTGAVGTAAGVTVTLLSGLYTLFYPDVNSIGAIVLASMALLLLAILILAIDNRIRINQAGGDENES